MTSGHNVCMHFLLGDCTFGSSACVSSHDKTTCPPAVGGTARVNTSFSGRFPAGKVPKEIQRSCPTCADSQTTVSYEVQRTVLRWRRYTGIGETRRMMDFAMPRTMACIPLSRREAGVVGGVVGVGSWRRRPRRPPARRWAQRTEFGRRDRREKEQLSASRRTRCKSSFLRVLSRGTMTPG